MLDTIVELTNSYIDKMSKNERNMDSSLPVKKQQYLCLNCMRYQIICQRFQY